MPSAPAFFDGSGGDIAFDPQTGQFITAISKANPGVITVSASVVSLGFIVGSTVAVTGVGGMTAINGTGYVVNTITGGSGSPWLITVKLAGTPVDTTGFGTYTGGGTIALAPDGGVSTTGIATCYNNLFDDGAFNTITWSPVANAQRYNIYRLSNGLYGFIGQAVGTSFIDPGGSDNITADISKTPPLQDNPFSGTGKYPAAVGYFDQRRCFAGPDLDPSYFWATRSGTESSLAYSIPGRDDDAIRFRIAARERCSIRHILPMWTLVLLSESSEWRVSPNAGEVLTPDVSVKAQSFIGANHAQPVAVNNNLLFAAARGGHVREMSYSWQANNYTGGYLAGDLCLRAPHLFDGLDIIDMAYAKAPTPIVWCVSSSGNLLGITYVPEEDVGPWHRHDTQDGTFESICVVPENGADVLYAVVLRSTALGQERFIERMEPRRAEDGIAGFFVDCGLSYSGSPATVFSGLDHLNGKTVSILADGAVMPQQVVVSGAVTLTSAASIVYVGLPITADVQTLPLAFEIDAAYGQGRPKNVNEAWLRVYSSRGVSIGPTFDKLTEQKPRTVEPYGSPPALFTGEVKVSVEPSWNLDGQLCVRHVDPLPMTIVSITVGFSVGG